MTNLRQAAQQAFNALEDHGDWEIFGGVMKALLDALAEPEEYAAQNPLGGPAKVFDAMADAIRAGDDYHATLRRYGFAEVKALAEPEQEPVAWMMVENKKYGDSVVLRKNKPKAYNAEWWTLEPLYTAPTPRKPLTDEALHQVIRAGNYDSMEQFARAIERAHGIGEQHE